MPDLPKATYNVWVRGYGLVDSPKTRTTPGKNLNLRAVPASSPAAAAHYYPAAHWLSLMEMPAKSEFPGTGDSGNGISPNMKSQGDWIRSVKSGGCTACHALGTQATREIPAALGPFSTTVAAWDRRVKSGQAGGQMSGALNQFGRARVLKMFADWTDRIRAGELPPAPQRPQGIERNVVITQWDWADPKAYLHDVVSTDRRNPRVNPNGPVYGALELSADYVPVLNPVTHTASRVPLTVRDPNTPPTSAAMPEPSPYWADEVIWTSKNNVHNPMLDHKGRVWLTSTVRPAANPAECKEGSSHPSAKLFPVANAGRHLAVYDPATKKLTHISTCFGTHHLMFAEDANHTLWTSGGGQVIGWLNTKMFDETHDEMKSQGWTALIRDANGNGKRDAYVEPDQPLDTSKDQRVGGALYAVAPAPDGSVWGTQLGYPGAIIRLAPGPNPPETALVEIYQPPVDEQGFSPRGGDVDRNGVYWAALASGHLASFDRTQVQRPSERSDSHRSALSRRLDAVYRSRCRSSRASPSPAAPRGATTRGWISSTRSASGATCRSIPGTPPKALLALKDGKFVTMRVPYPLGFYTKWMDGRIDDPNAGWKGRGIWTTISTRAPFHMETGKGTTSKVMKFQVRPEPLAK